MSLYLQKSTVFPFPTGPSWWIHGFSNKGVGFVDSKTVCYTCGNYVCFLNLETQKRHELQSPGRGIGALTANSHKGIFAFSDQKLPPSIFVYTYPYFQLKNKLKGTAKLDYASLALSNDGPYLGCCSSLPDHAITVWNWETAELLCTQPKAGRDVISLVFNPLNCLQLCALSTTSITVWDIEKSASFHALKPRVVELPATDGSFVDRLVQTSCTDSNKQSYFGPQMPLSVKSGLKGDKAQTILTKLCTKPRLTPTAICWKSASELYVGCAEGSLLLVDTNSLSVSICFNPTAADAIPELSSFQGLAFNENGLIAVGKESVVHCLQIKGAQINVTQTWQMEQPVTAVMYSPDNETVALFSDMGQIYMLNPTQSDQLVKVLDVLSGNFVAAALSHTDKNICVSVKDSGGLQLWSADGICIGSLSLKTEVTSLSCCPIAQYAAVGTATGDVLFIDLNREQEPRLVHQVHLYNTPVDHLVFDQEGHYLLTGASDSHVYVLDAKPSNRFSCIGCTVVPGPILSLSTQCIRESEQVKVLALCTGQKDKSHDGSLLTVFSLPMRDLAGPGCVDKYGCLSTSVLQVSRFEVPHPLQSCALGVSEVFAYCHKKKTLQRFQLPQDKGSVSEQQVVQLKPDQEVKSHPLGPVSLVLSPHQLWLASVGRDGRLCLQETASMKRNVELQCNSHRDGGVRSVSFSADNQTLVTTGYEDGSLLCSNLRIKGVDAEKLNEAAQYSQSMKNIFKSENPVLTDLPDWGPGSPAGTEKPEARLGAETKQEDSFLSAPPSQPTWLQSRREAISQERNKKYSEKADKLRKAMKKIRKTIQEMMRENDNAPENERLELSRFNLNVEDQKRLDSLMEQEVTQVKNEVKKKIAAKRYLREVLKRECWDSLKVKAKTVKAFQSEHELKNYPLKEPSEKEVKDLSRVEEMRKAEIAACTQGGPKRKSSTSSRHKKEQKEGPEAENAALSGSISARLGYSNPYLYDQLSMKTIDHKLSQIILLQDVIHRIKTGFNADFEASHRQKMQVLNRVKERNKRMKEIILELDMNQKLWEPSLSIWEQPERFLTVDDSEIKAQKYLSPEQKKEEEKKKSEQQRLSAANPDNLNKKALQAMMGGVLEARKGDILKVEIPVPEFVLSEPDTNWSEEEKQVYMDYEKKTQDLKEEKEKYKKSLETEMAKLQAVNLEEIKRFDDDLLLEKKLTCDAAINQEELKIFCLKHEVQIEEDIDNREQELKIELEKAAVHKAEISGEVKKREEELQVFQGSYDITVAEDKVLVKTFRKAFSDLRLHMVDHLFKLFKRRPKMRYQSPNLKDQPLCGSLAPNALDKILKAMEKLDAPVNMPEGLKPSIWERFCLVRRTKVESEHKVKVQTSTLAEMQSFLQRRRDEEKAAQLKIQNISDELESLHKEKNSFLTNIMVQLLLKRDQVEVSTKDLTVDYSDSILLHRNMVEDLNSTIRTHGKKNIASIVKYKHFRKGIIQLQWEHKKMSMQIEDLQNKERQIKLLRLSEEQHDYLNKTDPKSSVSNQISLLEETIANKEKIHLKSVQQRIKKIEEFNIEAARKAHENAILNQKICKLEATVADLENYNEAMNESREESERKHCEKSLQKRTLPKHTTRNSGKNMRF